MPIVKQYAKHWRHLFQDKHFINHILFRYVCPFKAQKYPMSKLIITCFKSDMTNQNIENIYLKTWSAIKNNLTRFDKKSRTRMILGLITFRFRRHKNLTQTHTISEFITTHSCTSRRVSYASYVSSYDSSSI